MSILVCDTWQMTSEVSHPAGKMGSEQGKRFMSKHRTMTISRFRWLAALLAAALVAAACSSDPDEAAPPTAEPADTTAAPVTTTTEAAAEPADTIEAAEPTVTTTADETPATTAAGDEATGEADEPTTEAEADEAPDGADSDEAADEPAGDDPATGDEGEPDEGDAVEEEPEAEEPAEPNYENRSAGSVFPDSAYYDHDAIRGLFPECLPPPDDSFGWVNRVFDYWHQTYAGWDTESVKIGGYTIASGWWTDEQLEMFFPGDRITAALAREHAAYFRSTNYVTLWDHARLPSGEGILERNVSYWPLLWDDGSYTFANLYRRLAAMGYSDTESEPSSTEELLAVVRDDGVPGNDPNPDGINVSHMLAEWMVTRYQFPPTTREPAAWAMRTLLTAREATCVAEGMKAVCEGDDLAGIGDQSAQVLKRSHRFGRVLWSLVCPEA